MLFRVLSRILDYYTLMGHYMNRIDSNRTERLVRRCQSERKNHRVTILWYPIIRKHSEIRDLRQRPMHIGILQDTKRVQWTNQIKRRTNVFKWESRRLQAPCTEKDQIMEDANAERKVKTNARMQYFRLMYWFSSQLQYETSLLIHRWWSQAGYQYYIYYYRYFIIYHAFISHSC